MTLEHPNSTSLTERFPTHPESVSVEGGVCGAQCSVALDPLIYRDMRWCVNCAGEQVFVEVFECEAGRVGVCMGCGDERVVRFSRTTEEAA